MTFCYLPCFDVSDTDYGFGTITMSTAGKTNISASIPSLSSFNGDFTIGVSTFSHYPTGWSGATGEDVDDNTGALKLGSFFSFGESLQATLRTDATAKSWTSPSSISVTFSTTTLLYTIAYSGAAMTAITFSNSQSRVLLGFAANFSGSSNSQTGTLTPRFCISPTLSAVSVADEPLNVDVPKLTAEATNAIGQRWGLFRSTQPFYRNWHQEHETKAKTIRQSAVAAHPSTFQELFEACRTARPFVVVNGWGDSRNELFYLRPSSCAWKPRRSGGDLDDAHFDIGFQCLCAGVFP
jgi:hypothetical protein